MEISGGDGGNLILKELAIERFTFQDYGTWGDFRNDKWLNEYELKLKGTDSFGNSSEF